MSRLKLFGYGEPRQPQPGPDSGPPEPLEEPGGGEERSTVPDSRENGTVETQRDLSERSALTPAGYGDGRATGRLRYGDWIGPENGEHIPMGVSDNGGNVSQLQGQPPTARRGFWGNISWAINGGRVGVGR